MPFNYYNGVVQNTPNSCGAFALAAALSELKNLPLQRVDTANPLNRYTTNHIAPAAFASYIYEITGCLLLTPAPHPTATYQYLAPVQNMNPPSALVYVASKMGLPPANIFVSYNNVAQFTFQACAVTNNGGAPGNLLAAEINIITGPPLYANVVGPTNYVNPPGPNQVDIVLVENFSHWVAVTATHIYDPGTGFVGNYTPVPNPIGPHNPLTALRYNNAGGQVNLNFSGIWIRLG